MNMPQPKNATPLLDSEGRPYTFERALERLERIVEELEDGRLALEDSLRRFEEGIGLTRFLERELESAQKRVLELIETPAGPATRPGAGEERIASDDDEVEDRP